MRIELTNPFAAHGITVVTKKLQVSRSRCRKRRSAEPNFTTCLQLWLSAVMALHPSSSTAPVSGAPTSSTSGLSSAHPVPSLGSSVTVQPLAVRVRALLAILILLLLLSMSLLRFGGVGLIRAAHEGVATAVRSCFARRSYPLRVARLRPTLPGWHARIGGSVAVVCHADKLLLCCTPSAFTNTVSPYIRQAPGIVMLTRPVGEPGTCKGVSRYSALTLLCHADTQGQNDVKLSC